MAYPARPTRCRVRSILWCWAPRLLRGFLVLWEWLIPARPQGTARPTRGRLGLTGRRCAVSLARSARQSAFPVVINCESFSADHSFSRVRPQVARTHERNHPCRVCFLPSLFCRTQSASLNHRSEEGLVGVGLGLVCRHGVRPLLCTTYVCALFLFCPGHKGAVGGGKGTEGYDERRVG